MTRPSVSRSIDCTSALSAVVVPDRRIGFLVMPTQSWSVSSDGLSARRNASSGWCLCQMCRKNSRRGSTAPRKARKDSATVARAQRRVAFAGKPATSSLRNAGRARLQSRRACCVLVISQPGRPRPRRPRRAGRPQPHPHPLRQRRCSRATARPVRSDPISISRAGTRDLCAATPRSKPSPPCATARSRPYRRR